MEKDKKQVKTKLKLTCIGMDVKVMLLMAGYLCSNMLFSYILHEPSYSEKLIKQKNIWIFDVKDKLIFYIGVSQDPTYRHVIKNSTTLEV